MKGLTRCAAAAMLYATTVYGIAEGQVSHAYDGSSSFCNGDNLLFYNAKTGEGAVGKVTSSGFTTTKTYPTGAFAKNWTLVAPVASFGSILLYQSSSGSGAVGTLRSSGFITTQTYSDLSPGWSNILYVGMDRLPFFYNSSDGSGALGYAPTQRPYAAGDFSPGWTHIVWTNSGVLFYDTNEGSGAVVVPVSSGSAGPLHPNNDLKTTKTFPSGAFLKDWTHVAATASRILFYNYATGAGAIGRLTPSSPGSASDFVTDMSYDPGQFAPHWTHVVSAGADLVFFYNATTGEGAIGQINGSRLTTTRVYPRGSFARGFTHVVCSQDAPPGPR